MLIKTTLLVCTMLLCLPYTHAMRTLPIVSNHSRTIITGDGKEHTKVKLEQLADCGVISAALEYRPAEIHMPALTSRQWQAFQECLQEESTGNTQETRKRLRDQKTLHDTLMAANYLDHAQLIQTASAIWAEEQFEAVGPRALPRDLELRIAIKILASTPLAQKLPIWIIRGTNMPQHVTESTEEIWSCCTNAACTLTVFGTTDGKITSIDTRTQKAHSWQAHTKPVSELHFNPHNGLLYSAAQDGVIKAWDTEHEGILSHQLETETAVLTFTFRINHTGTLLATPGEHGVAVWDLASRTMRKIPTPDQTPKSVAFNANSSLIAVANAEHNVLILDTLTGNALQKLETPEELINQVQFNHTTTQLAAASRTGRIFIWNVADYSLMATLPGHSDSIWALTFSPCNRFLFSCSSDKKVKIWDMDTMECIKTIKHLKKVTDLKLTSELQLLTSSNDKKVRLIPTQKFLNRYYERKKYLEQNVTIPQAKLIKKAFEADHNKPLNVAKEKYAATFNQFPAEIRAMLLKELSLEKTKSTLKKRRTNDKADNDYVP